MTFLKNIGVMMLRPTVRIVRNVDQKKRRWTDFEHSKMTLNISKTIGILKVVIERAFNNNL